MRFLSLFSLLLISVWPGLAETAQERLKAATDVFTEVMSTPDKGIPQDLLDRANCVVIVPAMKSGGFIVGAKYGKGFVECRRSGGTGWGAPAAVRIEGGSVGFQIGGQATDLILLVMNQHGINDLLRDKFTLGGDASVAAGPVGRDASAQTGAGLKAEILSWSRSRGAFAGVSLQGATLRQDLDDNRELYGSKVTNSEILLHHAEHPPAAASGLIAALNKYSPRETGSEGRAARQKRD